MNANEDLLSKGIYSLADASLLTGTTKATITNCIKGYTRMNVVSEPLITIDYIPIHDFYSISFLDLIELFFVNAFRKRGVSLKTIRMVYNKAKDKIGFNHPFSTMKFKTDGKSILMQVDDRTLLTIINDQYEIKKILDPFLFDAFDFKQDVVNRIWPLGKNRQVVIDPNRSFGKPIVNKEGVLVEILFQAYKTEKSFKKVASWFEVSNKSVKDAVDYYQKLAA